MCCSRLPAIELTDNVTSIGNEAFSGCSALENADLGEGVTNIGSLAFQGCSSLKSLILPDSVTTLGYEMIRETGVSSIMIPKNVRTSKTNGFPAAVVNSQSNMVKPPQRSTTIAALFLNYTPCTSHKARTGLLHGRKGNYPPCDSSA